LTQEWLNDLNQHKSQFTGSKNQFWFSSLIKRQEVRIIALKKKKKKELQLLLSTANSKIKHKPVSTTNKNKRRKYRAAGAYCYRKTQRGKLSELHETQ